MFEATQDGLGKNASVHSIHGSLLAVGELLRNTGEFMMSRYREVADIVLKYLEHRDRLVRLSITSLLPRIAHFLRDRFVTNYLKICMDHILTVLRIPAERASGFIALGEMAGALDGELIHYLPTITSHLRDAIAPRRGRPSLEALACIGSFAKAMGVAMEPYIRSLLDVMFSAGLSSTLVEALEQITDSIPSLLPTIQERLLDCISMALSKSPYPQARLGVTVARPNVMAGTQQVSDVTGSTLVQLALRTLARFNFKGHELLEFARDSVVIYLDDDDGATRRDAACCCCSLVANSFCGASTAQFGSSRSNRSGGGRRRRLIEEHPLDQQGGRFIIDNAFITDLIVAKLLIAAVADPDVNVRLSVFLALHGNGGFDEFLAQADSLSAIFVALNDEKPLAISQSDWVVRSVVVDFDVREIAISVAGRLSEKNPAYVLPALRRHLIQLLMYLEQSSADSKCREESAKLLGCLIRNCERLILPYIAPIHKALVAKLRDGTGVNANNGVVTGVLATVGELARVVSLNRAAPLTNIYKMLLAGWTPKYLSNIYTGGFAMKQYLCELMPLIVEALLDGAVAAKREVAVATLGQVVQSTGYVIAPYKEYPQLLGLLLKLLNGELVWSTRKEVLKVLGIMGALDPHVHKRNQQNLPGSHGEITRPASDTGQHIRSMEELPLDLGPSFATSEDYYATVAINSLMRILRDPSLSSYHQKVVGSLMFIFKSMGLGCVPYLPKQGMKGEMMTSVRYVDVDYKLNEDKIVGFSKKEEEDSTVVEKVQILWVDDFATSSWGSELLVSLAYGITVGCCHRICEWAAAKFAIGLPPTLLLGDSVMARDIIIDSKPSCGMDARMPSVVLPELFHTVRTCEDGLKEFINWKLGTLVSIVRQHIRKYLPELFALISELWSSFCLPATIRSVQGLPILLLVEQLCLALNDEFRVHLPDILPCCIQVLSDAERCNDYTYVPDILHTLEVFGGTLDEHMHLLLPALIRLFKVDASVEIRRAAIRTLTKLIPRVQVVKDISVVLASILGDEPTIMNNDELRQDAVDALCCLAHALGEDFTIFIPSIHKLLLKHRLRHKDFDEIEGRLRRREPLILDSISAQKLIRRLPVEVISDPINDTDNDPYEEGSEMHRQLRSHQATAGGIACWRKPKTDDKILSYSLQLIAGLVNDGRLRTAGEASQRSTKEDWAEWMRHFSIELLKESPSPALRTCARLAQLQPFVGRELFAAGFVSCWSQLNETNQQQLVRSLELAFSSPNIPPEILATLLNLAEFMEHDEKPLPIDIRLLGALAEKCRAFAKALHYKEMEFEGARSKKMDANPVSVVEALIHINNQLHQHEAAVGILTYAQQHLDVQLKESWHEKLQRWDDALKAYTLKASQATSPHVLLDVTLGRMRCLAALARWEELNSLCKEYWTPAEPAARLEMAPMAASAAWNMGEWEQMSEYVSRLDDGDENKFRILGNTAASGDGSSNGAFFKAVLCIRNRNYDQARECVERARKCLATDLAALVLESYERAYSNMVRVQQLAELEEVIDYCTLPVANSVAEGRRALIRNMWNERIQGTKRNVEVWHALLVVRALVLPPTEDVETWLKFASLCRKSGRISQARSTLVKLLQYDPELSPASSSYHGPPEVMLAYLKYQWSLGEDHKRKEAFSRLQDLSRDLACMGNLAPVTLASASGSHTPLLARVYRWLGVWQWALFPGLDDGSVQEILMAFRSATQCAQDWAKAWHTWALFNTAVMSHYTLKGFPGITEQYVVAAVTGYFHSIACAATSKGADDSLQDILRLLTLWFNHGATSEVQMALQKGFSLVRIETWLVVLPQIIARIHSNNHAVRELIQSLLVRIGRAHPQNYISGRAAVHSSQDNLLDCGE
ncbi:hypothetical protein ACLOJK_003664 [Asimina triloba]